MKILFRGWFEIPHSYSMVNCFQIVNLFKKYNSEIEFYIEEMPYYRNEWNKVRQMVYSTESNNILSNLKKWNGEEIDLIYSITYPYNITMETINGKIIPKCVFYTSEFSTLDASYFSNNSIENVIENINNEKLYMTSPSVWSSNGMKKFNLPDERNRIITHGVDCDIFKHDIKSRNNIRKFYKVKDDDILIINIGAMTKNKGILLILQSLNILVNKLGKTYYKLLLKGTGDLYQTKEFLEKYFEELQNANVITKEEMNNLLSNYIIFTDKTLSYSKINDLYNASDIYLSPYLAEGFNLTCLEALASGLPVMVPKTGSTKEYINDIFNNGGEKYINYIDSNVINPYMDFKQNDITLEAVLNTIILNEDKIKEIKNNRHLTENYLKMSQYISKNYSWENVSTMLFDYFKYILNKN